MRTVTEYGFAGLLGAAAYCYLEMVCRGRTHWSMMLAGALSMLCMYFLHKRMQPGGRLVRCLLGCLMITCIEFALGLFVNRKLRLCVWDYSGVPYNLLGQVCPKYSALWFLLCYPADMLCARIRKVFQNPQFCAK